MMTEPKTYESRAWARARRRMAGDERTRTGRAHNLRHKTSPTAGPPPPERNRCSWRMSTRSPRGLAGLGPHGGGALHDPAGVHRDAVPRTTDERPPPPLCWNPWPVCVEVTPASPFALGPTEIHRASIARDR